MTSAKLLLNSITQKYFQFKGRASRKEFWLFTICTVSLGFIMLDVGLFIFKNNFWFNKVIGFIYPIYSMLITIPSFAVSVRRLHDINFSGWWFFIFVFIMPIFVFIWLMIFGTSFKENETFIIFCSASLLLIPMSFKGTAGPNKYGEEPKN